MKAKAYKSCISYFITFFLSSKSILFSSSSSTLLLTSWTSLQTLLVIFKYATCNQQHGTNSKVSIHCCTHDTRNGYKTWMVCQLYFIVHSIQCNAHNIYIEYCGICSGSPQLSNRTYISSKICSITKFSHKKVWIKTRKGNEMPIKVITQVAT